MNVDPAAATVPVALALSSLSPGDIVAERYRVEATVGRGGMGVVYRVQHIYMRKRFALKVLDCAWAGIPGAFDRFEREAIALGKIADPHVAHATDFGRLPDGSCFLVLEYIDGRTLRRALERGPLKPRRALNIARGIVAAIQAAHAGGVIHRDLKPENIMLLRPDGDPDYVKVLDFGIASVESSSVSDDAPTKVLTKHGAVMGTPSYMSPEQVTGDRVDARTDLYAVGVILHEMLTGECPFRGEPAAVIRQHVMQEPPPLPQSIIDALGEPVAQVLRRLLAKNADERFASASELGLALDECFVPATERLAKPRTQPVVGSPPVERDATSSPLRWPARFLGYLEARRRRRRLRAALAWPRGMVQGLWRWSRHLLRPSTLSGSNALAKQFRRRVALDAARPRSRDLGLALAVVAALVLFVIGWHSEHAEGAPAKPAATMSHAVLPSGSTSSSAESAPVQRSGTKTTSGRQTKPEANALGR